MKTSLPSLAIVLIVALSLGCNKGQAAGREDVAIKTWEGNLGDNGIAKSGLARVLGGQAFVGIADGYQLWRGSYRGVPIALYSCMFQHSTFFQAEHPLEYPKDSLGVKFVRVVLVTEGNGARRVLIATHDYKGVEIDAVRFVHNPKDPTGVAIGAATVKVEDGGNGILRFQFNALKKPQWDSFDLEQTLKGRQLTGDKKIIEPVFAKYTPAQFAKVVTAEFAKLTYNNDEERLYTNFPTGEAEEIVAHPMWNDPDAISALIKSADDEQLVFILNVMQRKNGFDPWYMSRLEKATPAILELAKSDSKAVRRSLWGLPGWLPKDTKSMEPWLNSKYPELVGIALGAFHARKYVPSNIERVRELAKSSDEATRMSAETLLMTIQKNK